MSSKQGRSDRDRERESERRSEYRDRDRDRDRAGERDREGSRPRDDSRHQHRSHRESHTDRERDRQEPRDRGTQGRPPSAPPRGLDARSRDGRASRSPLPREAASGYTSGSTPNKGGTPGRAPKGNSVLAELLRQAKAKQAAGAASGGQGAAVGGSGSGDGSDGEGPEAGEILPAPIAQQLAGSKRRHSPIVWDPDSRDRDRDRTRASGDQGQGQGGPPAKRPATAPPGPPPRTSRLGGGGAGVGGGGLLERAAEELHAFRRQVALGELDYDPDAPAARKRSPSLSGDEEDPLSGRMADVRSGSADPGPRGGAGAGAGEQGREQDEQDEEEDDEHHGRPTGGSRWLAAGDSDSEDQEEGGRGRRGAAAGGDGGERSGRASPSPNRAVSGGEALSGRDGGGGGRSSASRSPGGTGPGGEGAAGGRGAAYDSPAVGGGLISAQIAALAECRSVDEYERLNRVSEGTYGVVFRARDKKTGRICALKKIKMEKERDGFPVTSIREINILLNLHHPNIVNVSEVVMGSSLNQIYMVMEFMDHDLKSLMNDKSQMSRSFSVAEVKCLMLQLLDGLHYLHDNWVIHRDLKTSNILYNNAGELKICDFGLARQFGSPLRPYTQPVVTLWYRPPELLLGETTYSTAVDMWSIGCIMAELLTGKPLFDGQGEIEQLDKICSIMGTPTEEVWPGLKKLPNWGKIVLRPQPSQLRQRFSSAFGSGATLTEAGLDLLGRLLAYDPAQRITAQEALEHRWFAESPFPQRRELMPTFRSNKDGTGPVRQAAVGGGSPPLHFLTAR